MGEGSQDSDYDVIVVGLGPAGANAAYHLGCAGIRTLAIEKKKMPRRKICAGGISAKVINLLDFDFSAAIEQEIKGAVINFRRIKSVEMSSEDIVGFVVNRPVFDHLLALRAGQTGVQIHEGESVYTVSERGNIIEVRTNRHIYRCQALIGADGVQGVTANVWGSSARPANIGLEVYVSCEHAVVRNHIHKLGFYFGYFSNGYGWIFPRREDASIGIGIPMKHARRARVFLADFLESLELPRELAAKAQGHGIPLFSPLTRRPFCRRNILLAGDAASFVDPVTAEGIYYALKSGEEAARAIIKTLPSGGKAASIYTNLLERGILTELKAAWKLSLAFYAFPLISFNAIMTNARIREMQFDVMVGRRSYVELMKEFPRMTSLMKKLLFTRFVSWKKHL